MESHWCPTQYVPRLPKSALPKCLRSVSGGVFRFSPHLSPNPSDTHPAGVTHASPPTKPPQGHPHSMPGPSSAAQAESLQKQVS